MPITTRCGACKGGFNAPDRLAGKKVKCPKCGEVAVVPAGALLVPGDSYLKFSVIFGISGVYMGFWETVESTTAATLLPASVRGVGFGALATVNGIGDVLSSILVGLMWVASPHLAMAFVIVTSLAGALVIASTAAA